MLCLSLVSMRGWRGVIECFFILDVLSSLFASGWCLC
jgi:hypothetical protein